MGNFILGIITGIVLFVLLLYVTCEIAEKNRDKDIRYVRMTKSEMEEYEKIYKKYKEYERKENRL